jgi:hypothetical protein
VTPNLIGEGSCQNWVTKQFHIEVGIDDGLTCRATAGRPEVPLSLSKFATMLRKRYYLGVVTYGGLEYDGRHDQLVDPDTFERCRSFWIQGTRPGRSSGCISIT